MFEELARHVLVTRVLDGQFERDRQHVEAVHCHPARSVCLFYRSSGRKLRAAVEHADVVAAEKPAFEHIVSQVILAIDPPSKIHQKFVKEAFEKSVVTLSAIRLLDQVDLPYRFGMHGRIYVIEIPLVGGYLAVRMEIDLVGEKPQLVLCKIEIDARKQDRKSTRLNSSHL